MMIFKVCVVEGWVLFLGHLTGRFFLKLGEVMPGLAVKEILIFF